MDEVRFRPGYVCGDWKIVRFVAAGGIGEVYEARDDSVPAALRIWPFVVAVVLAATLGILLLAAMRAAPTSAAATAASTAPVAPAAPVAPPQPTEVVVVTVSTVTTTTVTRPVAPRPTQPTATATTTKQRVLE